MIDKLRKVFEGGLIVDSSTNEELSGDLRLQADLGLDSLQLAVLTVKIEAEFGVDVFADGVVTTVGEIEEKIRRHQAETGASNPGGDVASDQGIGDTTTDVEREQACDDPVEREQSGE